MDRTRICPACGSENVFVIDSRMRKDTVYRRRKCGDCNYKYSTIEIINEEYFNLKKIEKKYNRIKSLFELYEI